MSTVLNIVKPCSLDNEFMKILEVAESDGNSSTGTDSVYTIRFSQTIVTPNMAKAIQELCRKRNNTTGTRTFDKKNLKKYQNDMEKGDFQTSDLALGVLGDDMILLDGNHRIHAQIAADVNQPYDIKIKVFSDHTTLAEHLDRYDTKSAGRSDVNVIELHEIDKRFGIKAPKLKLPLQAIADYHYGADADIFATSKDLNELVDITGVENFINVIKPILDYGKSTGAVGEMFKILFGHKESLKHLYFIYDKKMSASDFSTFITMIAESTTYGNKGNPFLNLTNLLIKPSSDETTLKHYIRHGFTVNDDKRAKQLKCSIGTNISKLSIRKAVINFITTAKFLKTNKCTINNLLKTAINLK